MQANNKTYEAVVSSEERSSTDLLLNSEEELK